MLNIIWPVFIIISIIFSFLSGKIDGFGNSVFNGAQEAVTTSITLLGSICLWNGIMNIALETSFVKKIEFIISPLIKFLFPEMKKNDKIKKEISMNMIANILGLGNAATPLGLKAINSMQEVNTEKNKLSNSMVMLIVINTASLQLIPTTVLAIRNSMGSQNSAQIIFPVWIATITAAIGGVITTKLLIKKSKK